MKNMNETTNSVYEPKEVYLNNPEDVRLAHYMYENNFDLTLLDNILGIFDSRDI